MITRLSGTLEAIEGNAATLAAEGGLAYEVLLPAFLAQRLQGRIGQVITLTTLQYLESQGQGTSFIPRLVGFQSVQERRFFELFTTVKGIGNRKALRAMAMEPAAIARAIVAKDAKALTKLPDIGKRMAETVIAELHGKVDAYLAPAEIEALEAAAGGAGAPSALTPLADEAVAALVTLGENRTDAEQLVTRALAKARREGREPTTASGVLELVFGGR